MSAVLSHDGKKENFIKLFILMHRKTLNMSELLLITLGMFEFSKAYFLSYGFLFESLLFRNLLHIIHRIRLKQKFTSNIIILFDCFDARMINKVN